MKKIFILLISLLMVGVLVGCDETTSTSNQAVPLQSFEETGTVQGTVFDAVMGTRIGDSSLKVTLVRGTTHASANVLKNSSNDTTFLGDFAFSGVPVTIGGVATYRIVAEMTGYQTFEGYINLAIVAASLGTGVIDDVYNFVRNIYMFPVGSYATAQTIYVYYDNEPVSGATVLFELQPTNGATTTVTSGNDPQGNATVQPVAVGLNAALSGTTDATGMVTFAGSTLVLGGSYNVTVLPTTHEGIPLATNTNVGLMVVGANATANVQVITMVDELGGINNEGLYVVSATPQDPEDILSSGVLTITFNRAIEIVSEQSFTATLNGETTAALTDGDGSNTAVAARVSADGLVLTLTPSFATAIVPYSTSTGPSGDGTADIGVSITYACTSGVTLKGDDQSTIYTLLVGGDGVQTLAGADVNTTVNLTAFTTD